MKELTKEKLKLGLQELERQHNQTDYEEKRNLVGKVLTITDAMTTDPDQRKAIKDLVHNAFWGNTPIGNRNTSLEAKLYEYLAEDILWDEQVESVLSAKPYNVFEAKLK